MIKARGLDEAGASRSFFCAVIDALWGHFWRHWKTLVGLCDSVWQRHSDTLEISEQLSH